MTDDTRRAHGPHIGPPYPVETIAPRRKALGITQMQLAAALQVQIETVRRWEGSHGNPDPTNQELLDRILGPREQEAGQ